MSKRRTRPTPRPEWRVTAYGSIRRDIDVVKLARTLIAIARAEAEAEAAARTEDLAPNEEATHD